MLEFLRKMPSSIYGPEVQFEYYKFVLRIGSEFIQEKWSFFLRYLDTNTKDVDPQIIIHIVRSLKNSIEACLPG